MVVSKVFSLTNWHSKAIDLRVWGCVDVGAGRGGSVYVFLRQG